MAIGIVGNYGNNNQGDEAILAGILNELEEAFGIRRSEVIVFCNHPEQAEQSHGVRSERLFKHRRTPVGKVIATIKANKPLVEQLDFLIIGGGGILMDLYMSSAVIFSMYGWMAKKAKVPYAIYGAGAGPLATGFGRRLIRKLVEGAVLTTVRDEESKQLLQSIGVERDITVMADPAFHANLPEKAAAPHPGISIGVTAVPYFNKAYWPIDDKGKYNNYITGMAENLDKLLAVHPETNIQFFSTKYPHDVAVTEDIFSSMTHQDRCRIHQEAMEFSGILELILEQHLVIGTRLHSLILAINAEKPVIGVAYHQKVRDFLTAIGCAENAILIEKLHEDPDQFRRIYESMRTDWQGTVKQFSSLSHKLKSNESSGMNLLKKALPPAVLEKIEGLSK